MGLYACVCVHVCVCVCICVCVCVCAVYCGVCACLHAVCVVKNNGYNLSLKLSLKKTFLLSWFMQN